jgi:hypothetical protein
LKDDADAVTSLYTMYTHLLNNPDTSMNFKCKLLDLLYFFCTDSCNKLASTSMKACLEKFVQLYFPLRSSELDKTDVSYTYYMNAVGKLVVSLDLTRSSDLLQIILNIYTRELKHACDTQIQPALIRFIRRVDFNGQTAISDLYMHQWLTMPLNTVNDHERKLIIYKKVLLIVLYYCDKSILVNIVCKHLASLVKLFDKELNNLQVFSDEKYFS